MFFRIMHMLLVLGLLAASVPITHRVQANAATVVINELMWMGSSASSSDEWIELRNLTDEMIDLSGWSLTKKSSGSEVAMLTIPSGQLEPHGYFVVANYAASHASSVQQVAPDLIEPDLTLANSALQIKLYNAGGTLIDTADDGSGNPLSGKYDNAAGIFYAMERNRVPGDGMLAQDWHVASGATNLKPGASERATPRAENSNAAPVSVAGADQAGTIGQELNFDGSDSSDPDNDALTYTWDFGDGTTASGLTPKHAYAAAGGFMVSLIVSDGLATASDVLNVEISSPPPAGTAPDPQPIGEGAAATSCDGVRLSELWPNPAGVDDGEFVELENITGQPVWLSGCRLWVNDKRVYTFDQLSVPARGFFVAEKAVTKLSLTNEGGVVRLEDSNGVELDRAEYAKAKDGLSWSRFADSWGWTETPTPGAVNIPPSEEGEVAGVSISSSGKAGKIVLDVVVGEIQELDSGEVVRFSGTITAPVDVLGARVTYLQDQSGAVSLLLAEDAEKPLVGDVVEVIGTVRAYQGRKRVSVKAEDIHIREHGKPWVPKVLLIEEVTPEVADQLVTVSGVIGAVSGSKITLDDGSGEGVIYLKSSTGILKPKMTSGDTLTATGIVQVATASGIRVHPRVNEDLVIEPAFSLANRQDSQTVNLPAASQHQTMWYWLLVAAGGLVAGIKPMVKWWKQKKMATSEFREPS